MKINEVVPSPCYSCKRVNDRASMMGDRSPKPGDIGICFYCHTINIYDGNLILREPTEAELLSIDEITMKEIKLYTDAIVLIRKEKESKDDKRI